MNRFGLTFHHLGLAVPSTAEAMQFLGPLGYRQGPVVFDPLQKVNLSMCRHATMPDVELVWPGDEPSPIDRMLKRGGPLVYHFCYSTADAAASLDVLLGQMAAYPDLNSMSLDDLHAYSIMGEFEPADLSEQLRGLHHCARLNLQSNPQFTAVRLKGEQNQLVRVVG